MFKKKAPCFQSVAIVADVLYERKLVDLRSDKINVFLEENLGPDSYVEVVRKYKSIVAENSLWVLISGLLSVADAVPYMNCRNCPIPLCYVKPLDLINNDDEINDRLKLIDSICGNIQEELGSCGIVCIVPPIPANVIEEDHISHHKLHRLSTEKMAPILSNINVNQLRRLYDQFCNAWTAKATSKLQHWLNKSPFNDFQQSGRSNIVSITVHNENVESNVYLAWKNYVRSFFNSLLKTHFPRDVLERWIPVKANNLFEQVVVLGHLRYVSKLQNSVMGMPVSFLDEDLDFDENGLNTLQRLHASFPRKTLWIVLIGISELAIPMQLGLPQCASTKCAICLPAFATKNNPAGERGFRGKKNLEMVNQILQSCSDFVLKCPTILGHGSSIFIAPILPQLALHAGLESMKPHEYFHEMHDFNPSVPILLGNIKDWLESTKYLDDQVLAMIIKSIPVNLKSRKLLERYRREREPVFDFVDTCRDERLLTLRDGWTSLMKDLLDYFLKLKALKNISDDQIQPPLNSGSEQNVMQFGTVGTDPSTFPYQHGCYPMPSYSATQATTADLYQFTPSTYSPHLAPAPIPYPAMPLTANPNPVDNPYLPLPSSHHNIEQVQLPYPVINPGPVSHPGGPQSGYDNHSAAVSPHIPLITSVPPQQSMDTVGNYQPCLQQSVDPVVNHQPYQQQSMDTDVNQRPYLPNYPPPLVPQVKTPQIDIPDYPPPSASQNIIPPQINIQNRNPSIDSSTSVSCARQALPIQVSSSDSIPQTSVENKAKAGRIIIQNVQTDMNITDVKGLIEIFGNLQNVDWPNDGKGSPGKFIIAGFANMKNAECASRVLGFLKVFGDDSSVKIFGQKDKEDGPKLEHDDMTFLLRIHDALDAIKKEIKSEPKESDAPGKNESKPTTESHSNGSSASSKDMKKLAPNTDQNNISTSKIKSEPSTDLYTVTVSNISNIISSLHINEMFVSLGAKRTGGTKEDGLVYTLKNYDAEWNILNNYRFPDKIMKVKISGPQSEDMTFSPKEKKEAMLRLSGPLSKVVKLIEEKLKETLAKEVNYYNFKTKPCLLRNKCQKKMFCHQYHSKYDKRRCPVTHKYSLKVCPHIDSSQGCPEKDNCPLSHSNLEAALHFHHFKSRICFDTVAGFCDKTKKNCFSAHPGTPDIFYHNKWKNLYIEGLEHTISYLAGAIRNLFKFPDLKCPRVLLISSSVEVIQLYANSIKDLAEVGGFKIKEIEDDKTNSGDASVLLLHVGVFLQLLPVSDMKLKNGIKLDRLKAMIFDDGPRIFEKMDTIDQFGLSRLNADVNIVITAENVSSSDLKAPIKFFHLDDEDLQIYRPNRGDKIRVSANCESPRKDRCMNALFPSLKKPAAAPQKSHVNISIKNLSGLSSSPRFANTEKDRQGHPSHSITSAKRIKSYHPTSTRKRSRSREKLRKRSRSRERSMTISPSHESNSSKVRRRVRASSRDRRRSRSSSRDEDRFSHSNDSRLSRERVNSRLSREKAESRSYPREGSSRDTICSWSSSRVDKIKHDACLDDERTPRRDDIRDQHQSASNKAYLRAREEKKLLEKVEELNREHDRELELYSNTPEVHPLYEEKYAHFIEQYNKEYEGVRNISSDHSEKLWLFFWKDTVRDLLQKEYKEAIQDVQENFRLSIQDIS